MEQKLQQLKAQLNSASAIYAEAHLKMCQAEKVMQTLKAQIAVIHALEVEADDDK